MQHPFIEKLGGGDLRSIGASNEIVQQVNHQAAFDILFECLYNPDRIVVMRSIDAIEKITISHPEYLSPHKKAILTMLDEAVNKELKWHLALLISRLKLTKAERIKARQTLMAWALDKKESKIVRVNSIQGLFELVKQYPAFQNDFDGMLLQLQKERTPSITARLKKLK